MRVNGREYEAYIEWAQEALGITEDEARLYADEVFGLTEVEP